MVEQGVFVAKLAKALQMLCHGYLEYSSSIEIIGHINLRIDNQKYDYIVNEQVSRQGGESTFFQSNSYHSLPPGKCCQTDRQHSGRFEEDGNMSNHHRVSDSLSAAGSNCVKVDLSGPVPYTHSTHFMQPCLSQESCFSTANSGASNSRRRSLSRDSRLRSAEEDQAATNHAQDMNFNHSNSTSKDREDMEVKINGDSVRTDTNVLAMYKDMERLRQQRQDMSVKHEPNERADSEADDPGAGVDSLMRDDDVMETSVASSMLPSAHAALAAHSGHSMLSTTSMAHPGFFDTSGLSSQDGSLIRPGLVQEALMQQILNAQKHAAHLALPGAAILQSPLALFASKSLPENFLQPLALNNQQQHNWNRPIPLLVPKIAQEPQPTNLTTDKAQPKPEKVRVRAKVKKKEAKKASEPVDVAQSRQSLPAEDDKAALQVTTKAEKMDSISSVPTTATEGEGGLVVARVGRRRNLSKRKLFRCSYCDYASSRRYNTERHIRLRHPFYRYKCPLENCGQILLDEAEYSVHVRVHGSGFTCPHCGIPCANYDTFLNHQDTCDSAAADRNGEHAAYVQDRDGVTFDQGDDNNEAQDLSCRGAAGGDDSTSTIARLNAGDDSTGTIARLNAEGGGETLEKENEEAEADHDMASEGEDEDCVMAAGDDDNLPVHFLVKQESVESVTESQVLKEQIVEPQNAVKREAVDSVAGSQVLKEQIVEPQAAAT